MHCALTGRATVWERLASSDSPHTFGYASDFPAVAARVPAQMGLPDYRLSAGRVRETKELLMTASHASITCLNCSRFLGEVSGTDGRLRLVRPGEGGLTPRVVGRQLRCGRCGGNAWIERV